MQKELEDDTRPLLSKVEIHSASRLLKLGIPGL